MREARIMRLYRHPNIVQLHGVAAQKDPMMLVIELAPGGSLLGYLHESGNKVTRPHPIRTLIPEVSL